MQYPRMCIFFLISFLIYSNFASEHKMICSFLPKSKTAVHFNHLIAHFNHFISHFNHFIVHFNHSIAHFREFQDIEKAVNFLFKQSSTLIKKSFNGFYNCARNILKTNLVEEYVRDIIKAENNAIFISVIWYHHRCHQCKHHTI